MWKTRVLCCTYSNHRLCQQPYGRHQSRHRHSTSGPSQENATVTCKSKVTQLICDSSAQRTSYESHSWQYCFKMYFSSLVLPPHPSVTQSVHSLEPAVLTCTIVEGATAAALNHIRREAPFLRRERWSGIK